MRQSAMHHLLQHVLQVGWLHTDIQVLPTLNWQRHEPGCELGTCRPATAAAARRGVVSDAHVQCLRPSSAAATSSGGPAANTSQFAGVRVSRSIIFPLGFGFREQTRPSVHAAVPHAGLGLEFEHGAVVCPDLGVHDLALLGGRSVSGGFYMARP